MTTILGPGEGRPFPSGGDRVTVKGVADLGKVGFALIDYSAAPDVPGRHYTCTTPSTRPGTCSRASSTFRLVKSGGALAPGASCWCPTVYRTLS
jgi:hypothetical protein